MPQQPHQSTIKTRIRARRVESATTAIEVFLPARNSSPLHAKIDKILHKVELMEGQLERLVSKGSPPAQDIISAGTSTGTATSTVNPIQQMIKEARPAKQLEVVGLIYNADNKLFYCKNA